MEAFFWEEEQFLWSFIHYFMDQFCDECLIILILNLFVYLRIQIKFLVFGLKPTWYELFSYEKCFHIIYIIF